MKAYLEPSEVRLLEEAAPCVRDELLIRILFRTGIRVSEALGLAVEDIDLKQGALTILHLKVRLNLACPDCNVRLAKSAVFCPGCGIKVDTPQLKETEHRRVRTIPLDRDTLVRLRKYIAPGGFKEKNGRHLLFAITSTRAWQVVRECAEKANLGDLVNPETGKPRHVSPHRLRDAFAVMAVQRDDSTDGVRMLQEQLGHASIGTTMRYRKISGKELRDWYGKLWEKE